MIDAGVPDERDEWPDGVLERLRAYRQGDVIERPPLFYFADPYAPVWSETRLYTDVASEPEVVYAREEVSAPYGIITTQTCDIAEEDSARPARPWVQVSPVYEVDKSWRKKVVKGRGPRYWVHVPQLQPADKVFAADLRIEMPIEKGWLAGKAPIDGFGDPAGRQTFADRVTWIRSRPALARELLDVIQDPLFGAFDQLLVDNPDLHAEIDSQVEEIALLTDDLLHPADVQVAFLGSSKFSAAAWEWLESWRDAQLAAAAEAGITLQAQGYMQFSEISADLYRRMTVIATGGISRQ